MVFNWLRTAKASPDERKASATGPVIAYQSSGRVAWSPRDKVSLTRNGFAGNVIGFRCVRMIAEAAASAPLVLTDGERRLEDHPVRRLLRAPNPGQLGAAFMEALYGHLILHGDAYVEAAGRMSNGAPAELHALRPDRMRVVPGPDGWPQAYEYAVGARKVRFEMGESRPILHLKSFHPLDDHYGMSPLEAAAAAIDVHNAAGRWSKGLLDNAAQPSGAIIYKSPDGATLTQDQYDRLVAELEANHQGARNAGRPMLLEGGLDWKPMGFSPSDMEFQETRAAAARDIAIAFGVPPMLLGLPGDATYANYQEANRAFWRQTVLPLVRRVSGALAAWLGEEMGERLELTPDMDAIPALAPEREALWRRVSAADFLTDAEKRALLGLPPAA
ncbi:phage portal protein [Oceanicella actignis]|uniref:Phage portal protein, HK97 family n=1 Tax=Oceanicella actignis TaxID=1189325 RepID=A0A1M7TZP1_9RHOB|nr:phage portal protein [Oceanicella actignis]TYO85055.1 HK97 family phage portal protein [Oceanicella actignis]SET83331.1 phage portal protein, HK97 family [Oceanicella actignis]SHN76165.1 phage portal protein, HK97 family [Oceanicella actignis]